MEDDSTCIKMSPGWRENKIFRIISSHRGINQDSIIKLSKMNKDPVFDALENLIKKKKIEFARIKQGEKIYFVRYSKKIGSFGENAPRMEDSFEKMRSTIFQSIENVEDKESSQKVAIVKNCFDAIVSYKAGIEFIIASTTYRGYPRAWDQLLKKADELLKEVAKYMVDDDYVYKQVLMYFTEKNIDSLGELDWFLRSIANKGPIT